MESFYAKSAVAQLTDHLREQIMSGQIGDTMPGVNHLVRELGIGTQTVIGAISALEKEGLLENRGGRRGRKVVRNSEKTPTRGLKIQIMLYEKCDAEEGFLVDLRHRLQDAGHVASFSSKSLFDLKMDPVRVARFVKRSRADAWIVFVGSRPVLEWFARQPFPSFALLGRGRNVNIAGLTISKTSAMSEILQRLTRFGHHRIVLMTREERRKPEPGTLEKHYLAELEAFGIRTGAYNLPDWDNNPQAFQAALASLFAHTPPTAILFDEPMLFLGALPFFARKRIRIPDDLSAVVLDRHASFVWSDPMPTYIDTDPPKWVRDILKWVRRVSRGIDDRRKTVVEAEIVEGGSIGTALQRS